MMGALGTFHPTLLPPPARRQQLKGDPLGGDASTPPIGHPYHEHHENQQENRARCLPAKTRDGAVLSTPHIVPAPGLEFRAPPDAGSRVPPPRASGFHVPAGGGVRRPRQRSHPPLGTSVWAARLGRRATGKGH